MIAFIIINHNTEEVEEALDRSCQGFHVVSRELMVIGDMSIFLHLSAILCRGGKVVNQAHTFLIHKSTVWKWRRLSTG